MTREDEIAARLARATPGLWYVQAEPQADGRLEWLVYHPETAKTLAHWMTEANATLIAHAPDDLSYLLGRVRELEQAAWNKEVAESEHD